MSSASDRTAPALVVALRLSITVFHLVCYDWVSQRLQRLYRVALARAKSYRLFTPARDMRASFILLSAPFVLLSRHQAKGEQIRKDAALDAVHHSGGREIGY